MFNRINLTPMLAAGVAIFSMPAASQVVGNYSGATADGNPVYFVVGTDPETGNLAVTGYNFRFSGLCSDGSTLNNGFGIGGGADIINKKTSFILAEFLLTNRFNLRFSADGSSATGRMASVVPSLSPVGPRPKKALICRSPAQTLNVKLTTTAIEYAPPPGAVWLAKPLSKPH